MFGKTHRQKKRDGDFSINDAGIGLKLYLKNSPPQVLSCQFCESFKNSCSIEYPRATAFYLPVLIHRYN